MPRPPFNSPDYVENLSQAEKLDWYARLRFACDDESAPLTVTVSRPPAGFKMPSMSRVREHDAAMMAHGSSCNVAHDADEDDDDESDEGDLRAFALHKRRDALREHSLVMPSQRGFREAYSEAVSYGYASE